MEVSSEFVEKILVADEKKRRLARVISVSTSAAVGPGENYSSNILRLKITLELASGEKQSKSLIAKRRLNQTDKYLDMMFNTEILMFENFLPKIESQLIKLLNPEEDYLWARFYGADKNNIFLEDLRESGYITASRNLMLDMDHMMFGIKGLARIHAATKITVASKQIDLSLLETSVFFLEGSIMDTFYNNFFKNILPHCETHLMRWLPIIHNLANTSIALKLGELRKNDPEDLKVLNHGDVWRNNFMYKYYNKKPISFKLVDFQLNHYSSLGWDLAYFLYTSVEAAKWDEEIPILVEVYRDELEESFSVLDLPSSEVPSVSRLLKEVSRLTTFSFIISLGIASIVLNTSEKKMTVDDLVVEGEDSTQVFSNPKFLDVLPVMLAYFERSGYLSQ